LDIGILSFDNLTGSIDAIGPLKLQSLALAPIEFVGGAIEMDQNGNLDIKKGQIHGNDTFRGKANLNAGETEVKVEYKSQGSFRRRSGTSLVRYLVIPHSKEFSL
jgi:hypothetical protein